MKYYEILGDYSGEVIGHCTSEGVLDVVEEDPGVCFGLITKKQFDNCEDLVGKVSKKVFYPEIIKTVKLKIVLES